MPFENHEKARSLFHRVLVEEISQDDRRWLDVHLMQCAECARYADLSARAVRALDCFAVELDPAAAHRVEILIQSRAQQMRSAESQARSLWVGTAVAVFLTFTGSAVAWRAAVWLASQWNLPSDVWQTAFAAFWVLPSLLLALLPLFRRRLLGEDSDRTGRTI